MAFNLSWFPFYPKDFLADERVKLMDHAQVGAYIILLCHQWNEGSIPADRHELSRLLRVLPEEFDKLWDRLEPCFVKHLTDKKRLLNIRLDAERCNAANISKFRQESGRRGGLAKAAHRLHVLADS